MRSGELCAGYGGLALAVEQVFGAETVWVAENEEAPARVLAHHWPGAPNHGDITRADWARVAPVDILSGGTPCQDLSTAGPRGGMTSGHRSNLWVHMREAIAVLRPTYVVWENVRGAFSARADSGVEPCPGCVGTARGHQPALRALGRVLGDLASLGFDAEWRGLRASDVGAAHPRYRVFVLAYDPRGGGGHQTVKHDGREAPAIDGTGVFDQSDSDPAGPRPHRAAAAHRHHIRHQRAGAVGGRGPGPADGGTAPDGQFTGWGEYWPAIRRWEHVTGRPCPSPVQPGRNGPILSARFTEWLMGMDDGWVTDPAIGLTRNQQIKLCGNGAVTLQAAAALEDMLAALHNRELLRFAANYGSMP